MRFLHFLVNTFLLFAFFVAALCGCNKEAVQPSTTKVSFIVDVMGTKGAVSAAGETNVLSLDLLAFRVADGQLDAYARNTASDRIEVSLSVGEPLHWYVVANVPEGTLSGFSSEAAFLAARTRLDATTAASMVMHADGENTFSATGGTPVEVDGVVMDRYACKVSVTDATVEWVESFDPKPSCVIDRVVLVNVRGDVPYSGTPTAAAGDLWYNKSSDDSHTGILSGMLAWTGSVSVTSGLRSFDVDAELYAMPNASAGTQTAIDTPWAPRRTRIAVRATIGGVSQWYPVDLPAMAGNCHYVVSNLVIRGPGTLTPDAAISRTNVSFTVSVAEWGSESKEVVFPTD